MRKPQQRRNTTRPRGLYMKPKLCINVADILFSLEEMREAYREPPCKQRKKNS